MYSATALEQCCLGQNGYGWLRRGFGFAFRDANVRVVALQFTAVVLLCCLRFTVLLFYDRSSVPRAGSRSARDQTVPRKLARRVPKAGKTQHNPTHQTFAKPEGKEGALVNGLPAPPGGPETASRPLPGGPSGPPGPPCFFGKMAPATPELSIF